jgi:hypothetical protein
LVNGPQKIEKRKYLKTFHAGKFNWFYAKNFKGENYYKGWALKTLLDRKNDRLFAPGTLPG